MDSRFSFNREKTNTYSLFHEIYFLRKPLTIKKKGEERRRRWKGCSEIEERGEKKNRPEINFNFSSPGEENCGFGNFFVLGRTALYLVAQG